MPIRVHGLVLSALALSACLVSGACTSKSTTSPTPKTDTPQISCPVVAPITSSTPAPVPFAAPAVTGGQPPVTVTCTPASGTTFPVGTTAVTCNAIDSLQRTTSCAFTVTITAPPQLSLTKFFAFGDSLTWGQDGQDDPNATPLSLSIRPFVRVYTPYPQVLGNTLNADYILQSGQFTVDNEGCPGEAAGDAGSPCGSSALARFGYIVRRGTQIGSVPYNAALIWEGANDVNEMAGDSLAEGRAMSALRSMIDYAKDFHLRPYLATLTYQNPNGVPSRVKGAGLVKQFNGDLTVLAQSEGITLVDLYNNVDPSLVAPDGLHLTQSGYNKVAQVFADTLASTARTTAATTSIRSTLRR